jgi:hypothetical protein
MNFEITTSILMAGSAGFLVLSFQAYRKARKMLREIPASEHLFEIRWLIDNINCKLKKLTDRHEELTKRCDKLHTESQVIADDETCLKIAHLIAAGEVFTNSGDWNPKSEKTTLYVNCIDVFDWDASDAEEISYAEISELYSMYKKDAFYGNAAWCIKKRKKMPQPPVERKMRETGIWNDLLDEIMAASPTSQTSGHVNYASTPRVNLDEIIGGLQTAVKQRDWQLVSDRLSELEARLAFLEVIEERV